MRKTRSLVRTGEDYAASGGGSGCSGKKLEGWNSGVGSAPPAGTSPDAAKDGTAADERLWQQACEYPGDEPSSPLPCWSCPEWSPACAWPCTAGPCMIEASCAQSKTSSGSADACSGNHPSRNSRTAFFSTRCMETQVYAPAGPRVSGTT